MELTLPPISDKVLTLDWQDKASQELVDSLCNGHRGALLRSGTGTGKMYMGAKALRMMYLAGQLPKSPGSVNPFSVLWLMPKNVKEDTMIVLHFYGLTSIVHCMSYSELRSSMGEMYITWIHDSVSNDDIPFWNMQMLPSIVMCDECQMLKNPKALQSRVVRAIPETVKVMMESATPYQRVVDGTTLLETFAVVSKFNNLPTTAETSERLVGMIAYPKSPDEYSPSTCERLREVLEPYTVELKNVHFKHNARTKCVDIYFKSPAERAAYNKLVTDLITDLRKRRHNGEIRPIDKLVLLQKMQQGAELLRAPHMADRAVANLPTKAVVIASNYVDTLRECYRQLVHVHKISPERIAFIVGGQTTEQRQQFKKDFQTGKRDILLFTMRSGGVGISLHHDRPTTKPRHIILPPTWSAIDLAQALGRVHRLTTISETTQEVLWYAETREQDVKQRVELKLRCIAKAIVAKEQFVDTFMKAIGEEIDADELASAAEQARHETDLPDKDDTDSKDEDDSITGEGLDNNE